MSGKSPAQAFREALHERWKARGHPVDSRPWEMIPAVERDELDFAAQAAIAAAGIDTAERDLIFADLGEMLEVLGLGDYARPSSPHEVFGQCIGRARALVTENAELRARVLQW